MDHIKGWTDVQKKITEDKIIKEIFKAILTTHSRSEKLVIGSLTVSGVALGLIISNFEQMLKFYNGDSLRCALTLILLSLCMGFISLFFGFVSYIYMQMDSYLMKKFVEIFSDLENQQEEFKKSTEIFPEVGLDWGRVLREFSSTHPWWLRWQNLDKHYQKGAEDSNYIMTKSFKNYQKHTLFLVLQVLLLLAFVIYLIFGI